MFHSRRNRKYKRKNKGMSLIEMIASFAILGIVVSLLAPSLYTFIKVRKHYDSELGFLRRNARTMELIEDAIDSSTFGEETFQGKSYLTNGKGIMNLSEIPPYLSQSHFKNTVKNGNSLFLSLPIYKNNSLNERYVSFTLLNDSLILTHYKTEDGIIKQRKNETIGENVTGSFEIIENAIKVHLSYSNGNKTVISEGIGKIRKYYE